MATLAGGPIDTVNTVRTMPEGTPLPPGIYEGVITRTTQKNTNDQTGVFVEVEFDIKAPVEFDGRKFWDHFNIVNASADASRIGKECLADLGAAAGYPLLEDDEQLQGQRVIMEIIVEPAKPYVDKKTGQQREGKAQNKCRKYWPLGTDIEAAKAAQKSAKGQATAAAPAAAARPAVPAGNRWGANKPAGAPAAAAAPAQAVAQAATPVAAPVAAAKPPTATQPQVAAPAQPAAAVAAQKAPWKRNKAQ